MLGSIGSGERSGNAGINDAAESVVLADVVDGKASNPEGRIASNQSGSPEGSADSVVDASSKLRSSGGNVIAGELGAEGAGGWALTPLNQSCTSIPPTSPGDFASGELNQSVTPLTAMLLETLGGAPPNQSNESADSEGAEGAGGVDEVSDDIQSNESVGGTEVAGVEPNQSFRLSVATIDDSVLAGG